MQKKKNPSLLKDHAGFSVGHEEDGTSCSFNPFLLFLLLLWLDKKSCQEACGCVSVLGARKGRRDSWVCAPQKLGGSGPLVGLLGWRRSKRSSASSNKVCDRSGCVGVSHKGEDLALLFKEDKKYRMGWSWCLHGWVRTGDHLLVHLTLSSLLKCL